MNSENKIPNILIIMTDEEPITGIGCYGNEIIKTPAQDSIANGGVRFTNHYCASYPCTPSRASIITGRYSHNHGLVSNDIQLSDEIPTLATILADFGYETAWIGKSHMGGHIYRLSDEDFKVKVRIPNTYGYEYEFVKGGVGEDESIGGFSHWIGGWKHYQKYLKQHETELPADVDITKTGGHRIAPASENQHEFSKISEDHHVEHFLADETINFLNSMKNKAQPFCCVLSFYGPHSPVAPPKPWDDMYKIEDIELPQNFDASLECKPFAQYSTPGKFVRSRWTEARCKDYIRRYYGFISYIDNQIERVLDALKTNQQDNDTIIVFTSDHGDMIGQFGMILKMGACGYDILMKTPLLIKWPGNIPNGKVIDALASNIDILPTLLDFAGVSIPEGIDGVSLKSTILNKYQCMDNNGEFSDARDKIFISVMGSGFVVRKGYWKFVLNCGAGNAVSMVKERQMDELYNMEEDIWEIANLAYIPEYVEIVDELKEEIFSWLKDTDHPYADIVRENAKIQASRKDNIYDT